MKFSAREKLIIKTAVIVISIGAVSEVGERYFALKRNLESSNQSKRSEITTFLESLEGEDLDSYTRKVELLDDQLFNARERVIALPSESEASLIVRQAISDSAEQSGVTLNSISSRRSKELDEETRLKEIRTYFGYDSDLESLLSFFSSFEGKPYYLSIDNLSISARQRPRRRVRSQRGKNNRPNIPQRRPLNGNAILVSLYLPDEKGTLDQYETTSLDRVPEEEPETGASEPGEDQGVQDVQGDEPTTTLTSTTTQKSPLGPRRPPEEPEEEEDDSLDDDSDDLEPEPPIKTQNTTEKNEPESTEPQREPKTIKPPIRPVIEEAKPAPTNEQPEEKTETGGEPEGKTGTRRETELPEADLESKPKPLTGPARKKNGI